MKRGLKYILLIIIAFSFGKAFSQSFITAGLLQVDSICEGTTGKMKLAMYSNNADQRVAYFRLMFEYDAALLEIKEITPTLLFANAAISYPATGQCLIVDTLEVPVNFYAAGFDSTTLVFEIAFNGLYQGIGQARFISDSCYFKTEDDVKIADFYQDSHDINIHPGFIEMILTQTAMGCSDQDEGAAEITITAGVPPYKYEWTAGTPFNQSNLHIRETLPGGDVGIRIIDGNGCLYDTLMTIETKRAAEFDWTYETLTSGYPPVSEFAVKEHPIHFYVNKDDGNGWNWLWKMYYTDPKSGARDSLELGERKNQTDFNYVFLVENDYEVHLSANHRTTGCDTTVIKDVTVEIADLTFNNLVTPNDNRFKIKANSNQKLRDVFVSHVLVIQDRTGRKVYETKDFPDDGWDGGGCPNGTYYYILKAKSTRKEYKYQGTLVILGGN